MRWKDIRGRMASEWFGSQCSDGQAQGWAQFLYRKGYEVWCDLEEGRLVVFAPTDPDDPLADGMAKFVEAQDSLVKEYLDEVKRVREATLASVLSSMSLRRKMRRS